MAKLPLPVSALEQYLPHRPTMVWVHEVLSLDESGGVCAVLDQPDASFRSATAIRWSSPIEWMAQSYGYVKAAQVETGLIVVDQLPKLTFLAQVRRAKIYAALDSNEFLVTVTLRRALGPMSLVLGNVHSPEGQHLASAELKLFAQ